MRIWDIPPRKLCRNHLLGEHRELHAIWSILIRSKKGYLKHPLDSLSLEREASGIISKAQAAG